MLRRIKTLIQRFLELKMKFLKLFTRIGIGIGIGKRIRIRIRI